MSSDTALVSGQGSGIGWQVNLPSFGSLALNLGVAALKQLATAGVSEHTLQCMLMIAEVCPASNEYRREISKCRQEQRKTAVWMCKTVELGTATNFVADELLKTRAGENVVALVSAVLPVMSEDSCDSVILGLFDDSGASSNTTPGFSQLQLLRAVLAPLLRKTDFKDKAFHYQSFLKRLLVDNKSLPSTFLDKVYDSIPSGETMVHMIQMLFELVQEGGRKIMAYHGLKGATWCITYARHVLGLAVCVLRTTVDLVPINGDYKNARVPVYIFEDESRCDILLRGNETDFFDVKGTERGGSCGWTIDTHNTNVLDCYLPPSELVRTRAVDIVASLVHHHTEYLARLIFTYSSGDPNLEEFGLVKYSVYCLPPVRERASRILGHLGFNSHRKSTTKTGPEILRQCFIERKINLPEPEKQNGRPDDKFVYHLSPGPAWLNSPCGTASPPSELLRLSNNENALEFNDDELNHVAFLCKIALAASWLAFTNWDRNLHTISVDFLSWKYGSWEAWLVAKLPLTNLLSDYSGIDSSDNYIGAAGFDFSMVMSPLVDFSISEMVGICGLIRFAATISFDGWLGWNSAFEHDEILAVHHRGFIVAHNAAIQQSLDMEAVYVYLLPGAICVNGERRELSTATSSMRSVGHLRHSIPKITTNR